jgi:hypothetical protein
MADKLLNCNLWFSGLFIMYIHHHLTVKTQKPKEGITWISLTCRNSKNLRWNTSSFEQYETEFEHRSIRYSFRELSQKIKLDVVDRFLESFRIGAVVGMTINRDDQTKQFIIFVPNQFHSGSCQQYFVPHTSILMHEVSNGNINDVVMAPLGCKLFSEDLIMYLLPPILFSISARNLPQTELQIMWDEDMAPLKSEVSVYLILSLFVEHVC